MFNRASLAVSTVLLLPALAVLGAPLLQAASPAPNPAAGAGGPAIRFAPPAVLQQGGGIRRESGPAPLTGAAPRTGLPSPFQPLDPPTFGANVRANTDTQNPNLAQQEPSIAINPTNVLNVVAAAKDERAGTNTKQTWIYTSTDGGVTWLNQLFPFAGGPSPFSSDPVVNFSDDGMLYVTSLPYGNGGQPGIQVARSTDGGLTFSTGVHLPGTNTNSDKEWTWVDNVPSSPYYHRVYTAWMNFGGGVPLRFNYSTDRGLTWSPAVNVTSNVLQFPMPVSLPNGHVILSYLSSANTLSYHRSTDGGATFPTSQAIANISQPNCPPDNPGCSIWRMNPIPANAVNRTNGAMVIVWADGRLGGALTYYARSTDNGATWSAPAQLAPPGVPNTYQVEPWVEADERGVFHAVWYDNRDTPNTSIFHIYYSQSLDDGATWLPAVRISTATSDLRIGIPSGYAQAAGDYIQVTAAQGNVYAAWTDTRAGNGEDIYVVRGVYSVTLTITPSPTPATTATSTPPPTVPPTLTSTPIPPSATPTTPATATAPPGTPTPTPCTIQFTDVDQNNPFYVFIRCLACRQIVSGYADGTFRWGNDVTRGQLSKIIAGAAGLGNAIPSSQQTFSDVPNSNTFWLFIERLSTIGAISGYACGGAGEPCDPSNRPYFRWGQNATRGQISKITAVTAGWNGPIPTSRQTFTDVPPNNPFWLWIEELAGRQIISGYTCGGAGEPCDPQNRPYFRWGANATRGQMSKIAASAFFPNCQTPAK